MSNSDLTQKCAAAATALSAAAKAVETACELLKRYAKDLGDLALSQCTTFEEVTSVLSTIDDSPVSKEEDDSEQSSSATSNDRSR